MKQRDANKIIASMASCMTSALNQGQLSPIHFNRGNKLSGRKGFQEALDGTERVVVVRDKVGRSSDKLTFDSSRYTLLNCQHLPGFK